MFLQLIDVRLYMPVYENVNNKAIFALFPNGSCGHRVSFYSCGKVRLLKDTRMTSATIYLCHALWEEDNYNERGMV